MHIQKNVPLAPFTTFKIGGPARFFVEAKNEDEVKKALDFAKEKNLPVFVLGGGSNVLVGDKGFDGLVIKINDLRLTIYNLKIECGAGVLLSKVVNESAKAGLEGMEWAAGIPRATIGGAVRGNAGAFGGSMAETVESVRALEIPNSKQQIPNKFQLQKSKIPNPKLQVTSCKLQDCRFSYRSSIFKQNPDLIILSVTLKLQESTFKEVQNKVEEIFEKRKKSQPRYASPGSFFKNPVVKDQKLIRDFETDTGKKIKDSKIPAGYLIDQVGLRGKKMGGAMVSEKHANFIVNTGSATADNVMTLVAIAKTRVRNRFGVQLDEEVQFVGF